MLLKPCDPGCPAHASYLVADEASGIAAIVAPQRDIDQYLQDASPLGLDIRYTFFTHFHADFFAAHHMSVTFLCGGRSPIGAAGEGPWLAGGACYDQGHFFSISKGV
jgi:glyoxylase-like metal-dependent hydrolase (beta-lactamase superfamily II)